MEALTLRSEQEFVVQNMVSKDIELVIYLRCFSFLNGLRLKYLVSTLSRWNLWIYQVPAFPLVIYCRTRSTLDSELHVLRFISILRLVNRYILNLYYNTSDVLDFITWSSKEKHAEGLPEHWNLLHFFNPTLLLTNLPDTRIMLKFCH